MKTESEFIYGVKVVSEKRKAEGEG